MDTASYLADDLPRKRASHLSPSRSLRPRLGLRDRSDDDERDRSRRFFFERLSSLFDRLRLRLFARVTVMNFLFTYVSISPSSYLCGNRTVSRVLGIDR